MLYVVMLLCLCSLLVVVGRGIAKTLGRKHALARQPALRPRVAKEGLRARHAHCCLCCLV